MGFKRNYFFKKVYSPINCYFIYFVYMYNTKNSVVWNTLTAEDEEFRHWRVSGKHEWSSALTGSCKSRRRLQCPVRESRLQLSWACAGDAPPPSRWSSGDTTSPRSTPNMCLIVKLFLGSSQLLVLVMQKTNICEFQVVLYKTINMDNLDQSNKNVNLQNRLTNYHNQTRLQILISVLFFFPDIIERQINISLKLKLYWSIKELNKQKNSLYRSLNSHTKTKYDTWQFFLNNEPIH